MSVPTEREFAREVVRRLREAGHEALWAGGCVRDELLGLDPKDYDVATSAHPEQVRRVFRRTIAVGQSFGVVEVLGDRPAPGQQPLKVQVATFREDVYANDGSDDGRHPERVRFCTPEEDARRRDFTINGMFFDPLDERLYDFVGGRQDLHARILRAIGVPQERFTEDKLRLLRAVRFAARFELALDPGTAEAVRAMAGQVVVCSAERISEELRKMLVHRHRARAVELFHVLGLAGPVLPELSATRDRGELLSRLAHLPEHPSVALAFAALLRDVDPEAVEPLAERLRLANEERDRIWWLLKNLEPFAELALQRVSAQKMLLGRPGILELVALSEADARAGRGSPAPAEFARARLAEWGDRDLHPRLLLNGHDLQSRGLPPGPLFKVLLDALLVAQLEGAVSTREQAWALVDQAQKSA